ncbi:Ger(x)C family spore germination protein [Bacillus sp. EB106-08-02-XG196]|nr:Ger(x)C family spore germination protein [Bacillus sp. EB106-08-02-XG196]
MGCTRMRTIDKVSMIHVFGLDKEEDQLVGTALYPKYTKSKDSDNIQLIKEKAPAGNLFYEKLDKHTDTPIKLAKIRVIVLGKKYAESGIGDMVERFIINPELGTSIQLAVSEHSAESVLKKFSKGDSLNLIDIIQHNMTRQYLPKTNLHVFLNHFYGQGMDAYIPVISIDDQMKMMVKGIGIFKDDKLKLMLNEEQTLIFSTLKNKRGEGSLKMDVEHRGKKGTIITRGHKSSQKWEIKKSNLNHPELNLTLKLRWTVSQYPEWIQLSNEKENELLKQLIEAEVKKRVDGLLVTLKEKEVDPLGIGNIVRSKMRVWNEKKFYEKYPSLPINVKVHLEIINSGLNV